MKQRSARRVCLLAISPVLAGTPAAYAAFPPPVQANPSAEYTAEVPIDYQNVLSYQRVIGFDEIFNPQPRVYWFKYTSNGRTALKLDTLGSDFGTTGPGGGGGGPVLPSYNQSQIAVYNAAGDKMGIAKNTRDLNGNPIPIYPTYSNNPDLWYHAMGLTETYFAPGLPTRNPHWDVDPNDPTGYTAWAAPGNEGNSQKYFPPHYPTTLNEYHVWHTALSPIILDMQGNPVLNDQGNPRPQPGWRYFDRARHGPGTPWNRFEQLPPGEYFFAIASTDPVFAGDTYVEEVLRAPIHYDPQTQQTNQQKLTEPMGPFQYYIETGPTMHYGNINLNVTQTPAPATLIWAGGLAGGVWDVQTTFNWKNGPVDDQFYANDYVVFNDTSTQTTVTLAPVGLTPTSVLVNANQNYTFTGTGSITGAASLTKMGDGRLTIANTGVNNYTGATAVLGGTLELANNSTLGTGPLLVGGAGAAVLAPGRATALKVGGLEVESPGTLDITNNAVVVDYTGDSPLADIAASVASAYDNGTWTGPGITSSNANAGQFGVGFAESAAIFGNFPATFRGVSVDDTSVLIAYTRYGDANLDGLVNLADFNRLAANFGSTSATWSQGDFNYDGIVNLADFNRLAANFGLSASGTDAPTPDDWSALMAAVPEPTAATGLLLGAGIFLRRRRRF